MAQRTRGGRRGKSPAWVIALLIVLLAAVLLMRLKLIPARHMRPRPPAPVEATPKTPREAPKPKPAEPPRPAPSPGPSPAPSPSPSPKPYPAPLQKELPGDVNGIALVMDDVGLKMDLLEEAAGKLPKSVTFAVIPFLSASTQAAQYLHERGFHVILHVPMEPEDSGHWRATPGSLLVGMPPGEVAKILDNDLANVPSAEGINNHMGSRATADEALMEGVMAHLKSRDLYFLDSRTTIKTVAYEAAHKAGVRTAFRAVFLDDVDEQGAIMEQVDHLVDRWHKEGTVVAIGHLRPNTIRALAKRIPYWEERGARFLPLREVVR